MLKILWKMGEIAPEEQFLPLSTIFYYLMLDFYVKTGIRFSLRDKRLFEITEVEITRVNCRCMITGFHGLEVTVKILCIGTDRSQQTVQTKIRLLLKKQFDQGLRCLPLHQLLLDALMQCYIKLYQF